MIEESASEAGRIVWEWEKIGIFSHSHKMRGTRAALRMRVNKALAMVEAGNTNEGKLYMGWGGEGRGSVEVGRGSTKN